ncbi:hypothetical protein ABVB72_17885 [Rhizobium nepotum]
MTDSRMLVEVGSNATRPSPAGALSPKVGSVPVGLAWRIVFVSQSLGGL